MRKRLGLFYLVCGLLPLWLQGAESTSPLINIGLLAPPQEAESLSLRQGAELGVASANLLPGPKGRLVVRGRPGQWGTEGDEAAELALDEGVGAMIAPLSGTASHQVMQVAGRTRIPVVSVCADASITRSGIPWIIQIVPRSDREAEAIFGSLTNKPGGKAQRWAALVPEGRAGREAGTDLLKAATAAGVSLAEPVLLHTNAFAVAVGKVLASHPTGLLLWLDPAMAGEAAKALRRSNFQGVLAGPGRLCSPSFLKVAGPAAEGVLIPAVAPSAESAEKNLQFVKAFQAQYGREPDFTAAMAYDAAMLLAAVLRSAGDHPPFRAFPLPEACLGVTGALRFDKEGTRQAALNLLSCEKGKFKPVRP